MSTKYLTMKQSLAAATGLAGFLGCATYGVDDYEKYPGYKKEIAVHFMNEVLGEVCEKHEVTNERLLCSQKECVQDTGRYETWACLKWSEPIEKRWSWEQIRALGVMTNWGCISFHGEMGCDIQTYNRFRAIGLEKAIREYLK